MTTEAATNQQQTESSTSPHGTPQEEVTRHFKERGKLQNLAKLKAVEHLAKMNEETRKTSEAEADWARRHVWDQQAAAEPESEDEMGDTTILGDVTIQQQPQYPQQPQAAPQPAPVPQPAPSPYYPPIPQPGQKKAASWIVPALLGATIPTAAGGGALATYLMTRGGPDPIEYEDQYGSMGLGKIQKED